VLGLHYPSDSEAGRKLANETFKMANSDNCPKLKGLIEAAANEWKEYTSR
jgi:hypothetical protein